MKILAITLFLMVGYVAVAGQEIALTPEQDMRITALDAAIVKAHNREILCDDKDYRETTEAAYVIKITKHINNPKVNPSMREWLRKNLASVTVDNGVKAMARRKTNLIKHQADLTAMKQRIIDENEVREIMK